jgi:hypothetical protein
LRTVLQIQEITLGPFFGNLNGIATDIGFDYQLKSSGGYKLKIETAPKIWEYDI